MGFKKDYVQKHKAKYTRRSLEASKRTEPTERLFVGVQEGAKVSPNADLERETDATQA